MLTVYMYTETHRHTHTQLKQEQQLISSLKVKHTFCTTTFELFV